MRQSIGRSKIWHAIDHYRFGIGRLLGDIFHRLLREITREYPGTVILLEPSSNDVGFSLDTDALTLNQIAKRCITAFPKLESLRVQRCWAALRVMTPDDFPVYQQSDSHPGAFSFACHSGVTLAASHALEVSQWVEAGAIPDKYQAFHPGRFHV